MDLFIANLLVYWDGRADLKRAFLGYFLVGNFALLYLMIFISGVCNLSLENNLGKVILGIFSIIFSLYYILTLKFVWACAKNAKLSLLFYSVRLLVIVFFMAYMLGLVHIIYYLIN